METIDKVLLCIYKRGFNDELNGRDKFRILTAIKRAYQLGSQHAIIGDDMPSTDYKTDEEILKQIYDK